MYTFTKSFRSQVFDFANSAKLVVKTGPRQEKNGTIALFDKITGSTYTLHQNGYIRREINTCSQFRLGSCRQQYTLNRRVPIKHAIPYPTYKGSLVSYQLVMASPKEQLEILKKRVAMYRVTHAL